MSIVHCLIPSPILESRTDTEMSMVIRTAENGVRTECMKVIISCPAVCTTVDLGERPKERLVLVVVLGMQGSDVRFDHVRMFSQL